MKKEERQRELERMRERQREGPREVGCKLEVDMRSPYDEARQTGVQGNIQPQFVGI